MTALLAVTTVGQISKTGTPTRIALVGSGGGENVLDAATALLSRDADLLLLDRAEVGRVLREQQISLSGVALAEQAVKAGQVLHVDLLGVLEGSLTNKAEASPSLGLVVFDARTGVRHADSALMASNEVSAASVTAAAVRIAVEKSRRAPKDLHTVGLLLVRNADLPRQLDGLCDSVRLLMERELTTSPGIAVLERRRLEQVTKERSVAPEAKGNGLLASLRMIELDIGQNGTGLRGTFALVGADGHRTNGITVSVATHDPAALAHLLAGRIMQLLNVPSDAAPADRAAEAGRFHREYRLLLTARDYVAAVQALDAAIALAPEQGDWLREMVLLLPDTAIEMIDPGNQTHQGLRPNYRQPPAESLTSSLAFGQRGADLLLDLSRDAVARAKPGEAVPEVLKWGYRLRLCRLLQKLAGINAAGSTSAAEIASLAGKERALRMEILEPFLRSRAVDQASFAAYGVPVNLWLHPSDRSSFPDPNQRGEDDVLILSHWVEASHKLNPPDGSGDYLPIANMEFFKNNPVEQVENFRLALEKDRDPVIRLYARLGRVAASMKGTSSTDATLAAEREFRRYAQELLTQGEASRPGPLRDHAREALHTALGMVINHPEGWMEFLEAARFAFDREDIQPQLFRSTASVLNNPRHRKLPEQLEVVNNALKLVLERPDAYPKSKLHPRIERDAFIKEFQHMRDQLAAELAGTNNSPLPSPWKQSVCLFDLSKSSKGFAWLFKPVLLDRQVFAVTLGIQQWGASEDSLQLVRVPLDGGPTALLGRAGITGIGWGLNGPDGLRRGPQRRFDKGLMSDWDWPDVVRTACTGAGNYFAATCAGVYCFPTNGGPVFRLCATNGLPSDDVQAVAFLDGRLYIAAGEHRRAGYLVSYDMVRREVAVLASSRRSERLSPLDDGPPFYVHSLLGEPNRHQLLLTISSFNVPNAKPRQTNSSMGIWTYSPADARFKRVAPLRLFTTPFRDFLRTENWAGLVDSTTLAVSGPNILFDLRNEQSRPVFESSSPPTTADGKRWLTPVDRQTGTARFVSGPYLICGGWLYSAMPFERRALTDARREEFPSLRTEYKFEPKEALQLLDDGQHVLAADQYSIWLLEVQTEPAQASVGKPDKTRTSTE